MSDIPRRQSFRFQSTPSVGRATLDTLAASGKINLFQSTPSVGRATIRLSDSRRQRFISIHALRGEGDLSARWSRPRSSHFNPRPPWGGRQQVGETTNIRRYISIHALRGEGDIETVMSDSRYVISIHALRGEGDEDLSDTVRRLRISIPALRGEGDGLTKTVRQSSARFQSTPSVGRAT